MSSDRELQITGALGTVTRARSQIVRNMSFIRLRGLLFPVLSKFLILQLFDGGGRGLGRLFPGEHEVRNGRALSLLILAGVLPLGTLILGLLGTFKVGFLSGISFETTCWIYAGFELVVALSLCQLAHSFWLIRVNLQQDPWLELDAAIQELAIPLPQGLNFDRPWTGESLLVFLDQVESSLQSEVNSG